MTQLNSTLVVGVLEQETQVNAVITALLDAGFQKERLGLAQKSSRKADTDLYQELRGLGVPDEAARFYDHEFQANKSVISVSANGREQEAWAILSNAGAYTYTPDTSNYSTTTHQTGTTTDYTQQDTSASVQQTEYAQQNASAAIQQNVDSTQDSVETPANDQESLQLRKEELQIDKEKVQTGEVRVHREIITEYKQITVPVTREELVIEHIPASERTATGKTEDDETLTIPVEGERVNVTKVPVTTEEVLLKKQTVQENVPVSDTVRREELHAEEEGDTRIRYNDDERTAP